MMRHSMVTLGPTTQDAYAKLRADICFLGVTGLHPDTGLTTGDAEEAALKTTMIQSAAETVVLATADKIGASSPWSIAPIDAMTRLIGTTERPSWLPEHCTYQRA